VYLISLALIWNVCPGLAKHMADAMHNTTYDNHNTTPPQTHLPILPLHLPDIFKTAPCEQPADSPTQTPTKKTCVLLSPFTHR
ncbi:hypothetical protein PAXRUDRAFT_159177, partial [Paxillus rubicundulus Ve08.2h10]